MLQIKRVKNEDLIKYGLNKSIKNAFIIISVTTAIPLFGLSLACGVITFLDITSSAPDAFCNGVCFVMDNVVKLEEKGINYFNNRSNKYVMKDFSEYINYVVVREIKKNNDKFKDFNEIIKNFGNEEINKNINEELFLEHFRYINKKFYDKKSSMLNIIDNYDLHNLFILFSINTFFKKGIDINKEIIFSDEERWKNAFTFKSSMNYEFKKLKVTQKTI